MAINRGWEVRGGLVRLIFVMMMMNMNRYLGFNLVVMMLSTRLGLEGHLMVMLNTRFGIVWELVDVDRKPPRND